MLLAFYHFRSICTQIIVATLILAHSNCIAEEQPAVSDPVSAANEAKTRLEASDLRFASSIEQLMSVLDNSIEQIPADSAESDFTNERQALLLIIRVTDELTKICDEVLQSLESYLVTGNKYFTDLQSSKETFEAAAAECRDWADDESFNDHRDDYLLMAECLDAMAIRCERLPKDLSQQYHDVEEIHTYLKNGRQVLVRCGSVLRAIPALQSGEKFGELDTRLKSYAQAYERLRGSLRKLHDQLEAETTSVPGINVVAAEGGESSTVSAPISWATIQISATKVSEPTDFCEPKPIIAIAHERPMKSAVIATVARATPKPPPLMRNVLVYRPSVQEDVQFTEVAQGQSVALNRTYRLTTSKSGTVSLRVTEKFPSSQGDTAHYWLAEIDRTSR